MSKRRIMVREDKETEEIKKVLYSYAFDVFEGDYRDISLVMEDLLRGQRVQTTFAFFYLLEEEE
jgi:hypothetical protein